MLINVNAAKCVGLDVVKVIVEADITPGIGIHLVGLPDVAVKESLLRTFTALESKGFQIPGRKIVINLAPADLHKYGSGYDLPIAVSILAATGQVSADRAGRFLIMGELGLGGEVRAIPGGLLFGELAEKEGLGGVILPEDCALEAARFCNIPVYGVGSLDDVLQILRFPEDSGIFLKNGKDSAYEESPGDSVEVDLADIVGQEGAKRGIEIAAAGGHNVMMIGSPGAGKSSLAKAIAGILPPMNAEEARMTGKIWSISGKKVRNGKFGRPFRSPHYSASIAALIGGGGGDSLLPGEVSLAQNGVLFLDEFGQMPRSVVESLRGPIEDRKVTISRLRSTVEFPASFMLVAASNPCPCGYWGEGQRCSCRPSQRLAYISKLSGPILERIDIHLWVRSVESSKIFSSVKAESSRTVRERVCAARKIQEERFKGLGILTNSEMDNKLSERFCHLNEECRDTMLKLMDQMGLSMRAFHRIIKVARTIADLDAYPEILPEHLIEASGFRFLDKIVHE